MARKDKDLVSEYLTITYGNNINDQADLFWSLRPVGKIKPKPMKLPETSMVENEQP